MSRQENNLGSLPCGHVMHFACLHTAFASKRECPICRAPYPQHSVKILKLFFDCSRAAGAADLSLDSILATDAAELDELNSRVREQNGEISLLESAMRTEKESNRGLVAELRKLGQEREAAVLELNTCKERLRCLDQEYQKNRRDSIELQLDNQKLKEREKVYRAQLAALSFSKDEERAALSKKDAPKEELVALITVLKRQNTDLMVRVQKLEQDVMMQEERSGSALQLLSNIERGSRLDDRSSATASLDSSFRKRSRIQSAVASYVRDAGPSAGTIQDADEDVSAGGFSALRLARQ
jgi:hypothetical protein